MSRRRILSSIVIFMIAALVGPLIHWTTWPPYDWPSADEYIVDLTLLLWPTQPLGVIEHSSGAGVALLITVGLNVIFFGLIGFAVGVALNRTIVLFVIYLLVASLICIVALWASGFNIRQVDALALAVALSFYAFAFWLSARFASS